MKRIYKYFTQFSKEDWEYLGYFAIIIGMVFIIPLIWFIDYLHSPEFAWQWAIWRFSLTESLRNWGLTR